MIWMPNLKLISSRSMTQETPTKVQWTQSALSDYFSCCTSLGWPTLG